MTREKIELLQEELDGPKSESFGFQYCGCGFGAYGECRRQRLQRLKAEGNETVTTCHGLKMPAADGNMRLTE